MTPLAIAVKTYLRPHCLRRLLTSLAEHCPGVPVLVGDDSPTPYPEVCSAFPAAEHFQLPEECGLSEGRNLLADELLRRGVASMVLMDDDFEAVPETDLGALVSMVECGAFDVCGGGLIHNGGPVTHCEGTFSLHQRDGHEGSILRCKNQPSTGAPMATEIVYNFFAARVQTVADVRWNPRDEMGEHWEFFLRCKEQGVRVGYLPTVLINHAIVHGDQAYDALRWEKQKRCHPNWMARRGIEKIVGGFNR